MTDPAGIAALSAGALAFISLLLGLVLAFRVRRLRSAQRAVLGEHGHDDLVAHAAGLQQAFAAHGGGFIAYVEDYASLGMSEQNYQWIRQAFHGLSPYDWGAA